MIRSEKELAVAACTLQKETILGFDTETKPAHRKGESYPPALVQLAGENEVFIFQLKYLGLPKDLLDILSNPKIIKAGVSLDFDISELVKVAPFKSAGFVDIADLAKKLGIQNHGLRGLAAVLLGFRISKTCRTSNWENRDLTSSQIRYAASDAWVGRELYKEICRLQKLHG